MNLTEAAFQAHTTARSRGLAETIWDTLEGTRSELLELVEALEDRAILTATPNPTETEVQLSDDHMREEAADVLICALTLLQHVADITGPFDVDAVVGAKMALNRTRGPRA